jgi:Lrp/AsnC family leucine-responsive transcriptional regulator
MISYQELDKIDIRILHLLQKNGRLTAMDIAEKVGLSPSPCARRIRHLYADGYISGMHASLNLNKLGIRVQVIAQIRLSRHSETVVEGFETAVKIMPEVTDCFTVSGDFDYLLRVICLDNEAYEKWLRQLQRLDLINTIDSRFIIRTVKVAGPILLTQ